MEPIQETGKAKSAEGLGEGDNTTRTPRWEFLLSLLNPQKCVEQTQTQTGAGRRGRTTAEGARGRKEGVTEGTLLLHAGFGSPNSEPGLGRGAELSSSGAVAGWFHNQLSAQALIPPCSSCRCSSPRVKHLATVHSGKKYLSFDVFTCWFVISNHNKRRALHVRVKALGAVKSHLSWCWEHRAVSSGSLKLAQVFLQLPAHSGDSSDVAWAPWVPFSALLGARVWIPQQQDLGAALSSSQTGLGISVLNLGDLILIILAGFNFNS